jgi:hypothetical protein
MDKSHRSTVPNYLPKDVTTKGKNVTGKIVWREESENITATSSCGCVCAQEDETGIFSWRSTQHSHYM